MGLTDWLQRCRLVAILRGVRPDEAVDIAAALDAAGIAIVEVPLNSPDPLDSIARIAARFGDRMLVGAGTVRSAAQVDAIADVAGRLIVTPHAADAVVRQAKARGLLACPGCFTPTEAFAMLDAGADGLKLFPAEAASPAVLRSLRAVLPAGTAMLPVGGIDASNLAPGTPPGPLASASAPQSTNQATNRTRYGKKPRNCRRRWQLAAERGPQAMNDPLLFRPAQPGTQPDNNSPQYRSTGARHPKQPLLAWPHTVTEATGPQFTPAQFAPIVDLSMSGGKLAMGERIIVRGRVTDEDDRPVANTMIEVWQANAAGRYNHPGDQHDAALDPNFTGEGRVFTDADGWYQYVTIKPGAYPWGNHANAWRPNHIHYSLFGAGFATRLITQMYFPGDPLLALDPIFHTVPDAAARERLISKFDLDITKPDWALGYRFDVVLRGRLATPMEG